VATGAPVRAVFSTAMDPSSITTSTFTLVRQGTTTPLAATVSYNSTSRTATLSPSASLTAGTTYEARVKSGSSGVKDQAGTPLASDKVWTFTTQSAAQSDTTPPVISNVRVTNITATSATITWTTNEPADSQVKYGTTSSVTQTTPRDATVVTSHSVTVTGLTPNTSYFYRPVSRDAAGNLTNGGTNRFTTAR
jgi:hypothetical protein